MVEGGTAHGWERSTDQLVCLEVPLPPYIKEQGGGRLAPIGAPGGEVLLLVGVGLPSFLLLLGGGNEGGEGEGKGGAAPPSPSPILTRGGGGARPTLAAPLSSLQGPCGPLTLRGGGFR